MTMHPSPTLSICIPTFNRSAFLRTTLTQISRCIAHAVGLGPNDVEVVVLDNFSTDNTAAVVKELRESIPNLHYRVSNENVGVELNIVRALQAGAGQWIWPFGDDDILTDEALVTILCAIASASADCGLLLLNYGQVDQDGITPLSRRVSDVPDGWQGELFGDQGLHTFRGSFDLLAFISAVIVRRSLLRFDTDYSAHRSYYGHVGIIAASCAHHRVKVIGPGTMTQRQGNTRLSADEPRAATVIINTGTFAGMTVMLKELCEVCPQALNVYRMSCKEGLGEIEDSKVMPVLHWTFNSFARPHLIEVMETDEATRIQDNLLAALIPLVHPSSARSAVVDFRRNWHLCRSALVLYFNLKSAL